MPKKDIKRVCSEYSIMCDKCAHEIFTMQIYKSDAVSAFRRKGWSIGARRNLCPKCRGDHDAK